eukprot:c21455_g3_i2.p1 GENE.c21455_g3_i2~~c21455_g3_i2.p1  ORF type:complete len:125 (+),score=49.61 c21455_g3_i2:23-376(+)
MGGSIALTYSQIKIENSRFSNGSALIAGGDIAILSGSYLSFKNCFSINSKSLIGGSIISISPDLISDSTGGIDIIDSNFLNCSASLQGGCISLFDSKISISNTTFINGKVIQVVQYL